LLVSPHIDYARGGPVYAHVWKLTLTRQHYATPFGVLPTAREVVETLAGAMGAETAFAGELYHSRAFWSVQWGWQTNETKTTLRGRAMRLTGNGLPGLSARDVSLLRSLGCTCFPLRET